MRGEDERRSAKERGRGSKPRNALALGLRNVPFSFFPYIKKDSLLPPLEVILSTTDHQIYVGCQHTASGEVIERRADDSKKDILQEEPGNNTARLGRALLNQKELKYRESLEDFNKLVSDNPRDVSYLKARATLAVEMNTPDLALLDLEEAAKLAPDDAEIYVMCGEIYLSQKKKREAYVAFEKAIELGVPRPELQDKLKASK